MKKGYLWGDDEESMDLQAYAKGLVNLNSLPPKDMDGRAQLLKKYKAGEGLKYGNRTDFTARTSR